MDQAWTSITSSPNGKPSQQGAAGADNEELSFGGRTPSNPNG